MSQQQIPLLPEFLIPPPVSSRPHRVVRAPIHLDDAGATKSAMYEPTTTCRRNVTPRAGFGRVEVHFLA